jgi:hypothetical protein
MQARAPESVQAQARHRVPCGHGIAVPVVATASPSTADLVSVPWPALGLLSESPVPPELLSESPAQPELRAGLQATEQLRCRRGGSTRLVHGLALSRNGDPGQFQLRGTAALFT